MNKMLKIAFFVLIGLITFGAGVFIYSILTAPKIEDFDEDFE